jgi:hypothetical protein
LKGHVSQLVSSSSASGLAVAVVAILALYTHVTPAEAAQVVIPHDDAAAPEAASA